MRGIHAYTVEGYLNFLIYFFFRYNKYLFLTKSRKILVTDTAINKKAELCFISSDGWGFFGLHKIVFNKNPLARNLSSEITGVGNQSKKVLGDIWG